MQRLRIEGGAVRCIAWLVAGGSGFWAICSLEIMVMHYKIEEMERRAIQIHKIRFSLL